MPLDWVTKHAPQAWRSQVSPHILPILIQRAKEGRTITYGDLADELKKRHGLEPQPRKTKYGPAIGAVGFALEDLGKKWGELIPPLNVLVVDARTKLPGDGGDIFALHFLRKDVRKTIKEQDRPALLLEAQRHVWEYPHTQWDKVAEALGAENAEPASGKLDDVEVLPLPPVPQHRHPESKEHKALKHWICVHPEELVEFGTFSQGTPEIGIASGDRLDAYFESRRQKLAVEVKASHASDAELVRGVFQVVKYREVLRAVQRTQGEVPNAQAVLVTTRAADKLTKNYCKRLNVRCIVVPLSAERRAKDA